jgi:DNA-binding NarL/FixJ family response regulator
MARRMDAFVPSEELTAADDGGVRRSLAEATDSSSAEGIELSGVWRSLVSQAMRVVDHFSTDERHYLLLEVNEPAEKVSMLPERRLAVLERVLLGQPQKAIAIELDVAPSTVTSRSSQGLELIGLRCSASRAPFILSLLAHAHHDQTPTRAGRISSLDYRGRRLRVLSTPRLDSLAFARLSPAENAVLCLRTEGNSHAEIARRRGASTRTIANQLASAMRKLAISGRSELLSYVARGGATAAGMQPRNAA